MARREDHLRHQQLHYASILPLNINGYSNHHDRHAARRSSEQERPRALYVDFEDGFEDQATNNDYFGFQPPEPYVHPPANFHLQSVEMISEVKNNNLSPYIRYQASRETSRPPTPIDTPPYLPRYNHRSNLPPSANPRQDFNRDFTNLNLLHSTDEKRDSPTQFSPGAIRLRIKQQEITPQPSTPSKLLLPQYFLVKYLGRTPCTELWGAKAVRAPIDDTVRNARQLSSMNEIPTLEACVSARGLTLTHRQSPARHRQHQSRNHSPERHQHGLIPLDNISYAMHDLKYSKIASCIVLRHLKTSPNDHKNTSDTLTECYTFLFQSKDHAHRFALALAEAFNVQHQSSRPSRQDRDEKREARSPPRRSRHRAGHHQRAGKYNEHHFKDSHV